MLSRLSAGLARLRDAVGFEPKNANAFNVTGQVSAVLGSNEVAMSMPFNCKKTRYYDVVCIRNTPN